VYKKDKYYMETQLLQIIKNDPWLEPYRTAIEGRYNYFLRKEKELTKNGKISLSEFATGYLYFGLHQTANEWILREWAPGATEIYLIGDFNQWHEQENYRLTRLENGVFEIRLPAYTLKHSDLYKLKIHWTGGQGERIPAWARRVVQDERTNIFSAQVWAPENPYQFQVRSCVTNT
jgi:1,4-alpha-glucan branching enzyme